MTVSQDMRIEGVGKVFGTTLALAPLDLQVKAGEFLAVLGPSGCGKSTLMRLLAGLERPDTGRIEIAGEDVTHKPAYMRDVAMVFQLFTLYPHLSVIDNVTFPLRAQGMPADTANPLAQRWLDRFEVGHLSKRRPAGISGGDRQKIAMARALVRSPRLFLFDEPLSALDPGAREALWEAVRKDLADRKATCLLVTHDQTEAMALGDRIAVLREGRLEQCDTPDTLYDKPANRFVADFVGMPGMNLLSGKRLGEWVTLNDLPMRLRVTQGIKDRLTMPQGEVPCTLGLRPEWVAVAEAGAQVEVEHMACLGSANLLEMRVRNAPLRAWLPAGVKLSRKDKVRVQFMASACRFFDNASGELLPWRALEVQCLPGA
jgi:ABC-type sugar transport system ATPase subunit